MGQHTVIIGNGISGTTAARWIRKRASEHRITMISEESPFHFSRTALMYVYMGHMRKEDIQPYEDWFWSKNRIDLVMDRVTGIDYDKQELSLQDGGSLRYDHLILAVGSTPNKFGWPGQDLDRVGGLYHMQDLDNMEAHSLGLSRAVVVGGGLIGIEMAEMFHSRKIDVTMLVREDSYWNNVLPAEEAVMVTRHIKHHGIDLRLGVNLGEIHDDGSGSACAVTVKESGEKIDCGYVGLTAGVSPNVRWLKDGPLAIERGIVVDDHLRTNMPNVYAIGDCAQLSSPVPGRRAIEAVWYTGRMMGETVAYNITGDTVAYDPGIWFNSAKFMDIEYQVYGDVPRELPDDWSTLYWEHDNGEHSIRLNYETATGRIRGFNLMGVRYRHEVCEKWLKDQTHIDGVLADLKLANFDPEFYDEYEDEVRTLYERQTGKLIKSKGKRKLDQVLAFLKG